MRRSKISLLTALMSLSVVSVSGCRSSQKHSEPVVPESSATDAYEASPGYPDAEIEPPLDGPRGLRGPSPVPEPPRVPPALGVSRVKQVGFASRVGEKISRPFGFTTPYATSHWASEGDCAEGACSEDACSEGECAEETRTDTCADPLECAELSRCAPVKKPLGTRFMETLKAPAKLFKSKKTQDCVSEDDGCVPAEECRIGCTTPFPKRYFQHNRGSCGEDIQCGEPNFPVSAELKKELTRQTIAESMPDPLLEQEDSSELTAEPLIPTTSPQSETQIAFEAFEKMRAPAERPESVPVLEAFGDASFGDTPVGDTSAAAERKPVSPFAPPSQAGLPIQRPDDVPLWPRLLSQPEIQKQPLKSTPSVPMNTTTPVRQISSGGNGLPVIQPRQFP